MKRTEWNCDICGARIEPKYRTISLAYDKSTSCYPSIIRLRVSQIRVIDGGSERDSELDICDSCNDKISSLISNIKSEVNTDEHN